MSKVFEYKYINKFRFTKWSFMEWGFRESNLSELEKAGKEGWEVIYTENNEWFFDNNKWFLKKETKNN